MKELEPASVKHIPVRKVNGGTSAAFSDVLSVEEPLEIRIRYGPAAARTEKNISVTMRTPGHDVELATGFLFTEGIITAFRDVKSAGHPAVECAPQKKNIVVVELAEHFVPQLMQADRNFYTTSSCGVCGKGAIQSIRTVSPFTGHNRPLLHLAPDVLYRLPEKLRAAQSDFAATGGIHASALFTTGGRLVQLREDVGRHNALDKLIGNALAGQSLPLNQHMLVLSGRASFELIQKAAMAGIPVIAAIGAPSTLAVELAMELDLTLLGFLKNNRFNIYHCGSHVQIPISDECE